MEDKQQTNNKDLSTRRPDVGERDQNEVRDRERWTGSRGGRGGRGSRGGFRGLDPSTNSNYTKEDEQVSWEQKVDKMRATEDINKSPKQANGSSPLTDSRTNKPTSTTSSFSQSAGTTNVPTQMYHEPPIKKSPQPVTNTEYTGSASLTAKRNQEPYQNSQTYSSKAQSNQSTFHPIEKEEENDYDNRDDRGRRVITNSSKSILTFVSLL